MIHSWLALLAVSTPLAFLAGCLLAPFRAGACRFMALAPVPAFVAAFAAPDGTTTLPVLGLTLMTDPAGRLLLGIAALLWMAAGRYAALTMPNDARRTRFAIWWLMTMTGSLGVFLAGGLASFYFMFSLGSLAAYGLITHDGSAGALRAGRVYMAFTLVSEAALLMGLVLLAPMSGDGSPSIAQAVAALPASATADWAIGLLLVAFAIKIGLVPLHVWLPPAHVNAPTAASAVLSGVGVKAGIIGLIRFLPFETGLPAWGMGLAVAGCLSAFYGAALGLTQTHPKSVLAYSTVSQMGFLAAILGLGLMAGDSDVVLPAALYAGFHIMVKGALFLGLGIYAMTGPANRRALAGIIAILAFSFAGLPLSGGYVAKMAVYPTLGIGPAATLATLAAVGSALLMAHFLTLLPPPASSAAAPLEHRASFRTHEGCFRFLMEHRIVRKPDSTFRSDALGLTGALSAFAAMALASMVVLWSVYPRIASPTGLMADLLDPKTLWAATWPIAVGVLLTLAMRRRGLRLPAVAPGDILAWARHGAGPAGRAGALADRLDKGLRRWRSGSLALVATAILLALLLSGCAGRPMGVLQPAAATVPGASTVNLLVATTRAPTSEPGVIFSGERGEGLSLVEIGVSIPPPGARVVGQVQWPSRLPADPARAFSTVSVTPIAGQPEARQWLKGHLPANRRVLIFVHGFNNRFEDAVYRYAQIVHDSGADVAPILFTWPSRARVFDYLYDRESTNFSRDALETLLRTVIADRDVGEITILAHSMGAWPVMEVIRQMGIKDGRIDPKLRNVILASPDIDSDVFATQWRRIPQPRPEIFLFTSQGDRALRLSRRISGNITRLGEVDPAVERYRAALEQSGIVVFDMTGVPGADRLNHGKFADNPEIVKLIGTRLIAGQMVTDSEASLGERISGLTIGLGKAVGGVAGAAISAPLAVIDPHTRRTYGEQVEQIGIDLQAMDQTQP